MRSFVVFAAFIVAACGVPTREFIPVLDSDVDYSAWTLPALSAALQDPNTPAPLIPYLTDALNHIMAEMWAGNTPETVIVATPADLLVPGGSPVSVVEQPIAAETPLAPVAPVVTPIVNPVAPVVDAAASSPLVQLIVNVIKATAAPVAPVVNPTPVAPVVNPTPVAPVNPIAVSPVIVAPSPVVNPIDVIAVLPIVPNPIDVIAISPPEVNPIDVIAISAPEVNPVDIANPLPIVPVGAVDVVGPLL